jgi:tetratricopeptide (TPR) repeat protein
LVAALPAWRAEGFTDMPALAPDETVKLSVACLRSSDPPTSKRVLDRWRRAAAAAFYQAGVERHRRLFLSEIIADFEAAASDCDPIHAARSSGLVDTIDARSRERVAWYYRVALAYSPDFAEAIYNQASLERDAGRVDAAFSLFLRAARARPHPRARQHAFLNANAFWEAAMIAVVRGRLEEAETLFRKALRRLDNFGPEHVYFPRLLQRLGKNLEAAEHFERITTYSHRYAPEYIEPDYSADELLPRQADGTPVDPAAPTAIAENVIYWGHIYFEGAKVDSLANVIAAAQAIAKDSFLGRILRRRTLQRRIRCAIVPAALAASAAAKM